MAMSTVLCAYREDLKNTAAGLEFPVTKMSSALALALHELMKTLPGPIPLGLDLGTGSGVHAAIMAAGGVSKVLAADINPEGLTRAQERFDRLRVKISETAEVEFANASLQSLASTSNRFDIVSTNPPSFFWEAAPDGPMTPVQDGVYDGAPDDPSKPSDSYLYQFFDSIVGQKLKDGGHVVCTWPGLQHRLVHEDGGKDAPIAHPTTLLRRWFGWRIDGAQGDPLAFYQYEAAISNYGLGNSFLTRLQNHIDKGGVYSGLVRAGNAGNKWKASYRFGLMGLQKVGDGHFRTIEFDDSYIPVAAVQP